MIMQYSINLPADYDMDIIRSRIARGGPIADDIAGLHCKAFMIAERSKGQPANVYAPVYFWDREAAMTDFIIGDKFKGIIDSFGRPTIERWQSVYTNLEKLHTVTMPVFVTKESIALEPSAILKAITLDEQHHAEQRLSAGSCVASSIGIDPVTWQLVRFDFWDSAPPKQTAQTHCYEVMYLARV